MVLVKSRKAAARERYVGVLPRAREAACRSVRGVSDLHSDVLIAWKLYLPRVRVEERSMMVCMAVEEIEASESSGDSDHVSDLRGNYGRPAVHSPHDRTATAR